MTWKNDIKKDIYGGGRYKGPIFGNMSKRTDEDVIYEASNLIVRAMAMLEEQLGSMEGQIKFKELVDELE